MNKQLPRSLRPHWFVFWGDRKNPLGGGNHPPLVGRGLNICLLYKLSIIFEANIEDLFSITINLYIFSLKKRQLRPSQRSRCALIHAWKQTNRHLTIYSKLCFHYLPQPIASQLMAGERKSEMEVKYKQQVTMSD